MRLTLDERTGSPKQCVMARTILSRIALGAGLVLAVVTVTFFLINLTPGDPARLWVGPSASAQELENARRALGLDRPVAIRYVTWLFQFVRGDWGISIAQQRPVQAILAAAIPYTILLSGASLALTYVGGIALGAFQAARSRSKWDKSITVATLVIYGMPAFWLAIILVLTFAYTSARNDWPAWLRFPALGAMSLDADFQSPVAQLADLAHHLVLPLVTLGLIGIASTTRFVRGSVLDARGMAFIVAARARGLASSIIQRRYILRNALLPVITLLGLSLPALFSGTVFVEVIFAWPGMGREIVTAVGARDYPVIMATTAVYAALVVVGNMLADVLYAVADPRLRQGLR